MNIVILVLFRDIMLLEPEFPEFSGRLIEDIPQVNFFACGQAAATTANDIHIRDILQLQSRM